MATAAVIARFALGSVFLLAGLAKIRERADLLHAVQNYQLLPPQAARVVAGMLPQVEVIGGSLLFLGVLTSADAAVLGCLLLGFVVAMALNLYRQREMDCGCFGRSVPERLGWNTVARNLILLVGSVLVIGWSPRTLALMPVWAPGGAGRHATDALGLLVVTTTCILGWRVASEARAVVRLSRNRVRQ